MGPNSSILPPLGRSLLTATGSTRSSSDRSHPDRQRGLPPRLVACAGPRRECPDRPPRTDCALDGHRDASVAGRQPPPHRTGLQHLCGKGEVDERPPACKLQFRSTWGSVTVIGTLLPRVNHITDRHTPVGCSIIPPRAYRACITVAHYRLSQFSGLSPFGLTIHGVQPTLFVQARRLRPAVVECPDRSAQKDR